MGVVDPFSVARAAGLELTGKSEGLTLTDGTMELRADFGRMLPRLKQGRLQQELLVKAARTKGVERPWAIDATAGFGEDSLLLAAAGFAVDLYEQDCVIAVLLQDALGMVDLSRVSMGVQDALASLPDHEFDALLVGMCSSVSTHIEGKGNCTLITGDLIDAALESTSQMYKLMYEVARFNKFLPFGLVGAGDATPATAG